MITWRFIFRIQIKGKWCFQRSPFQTQFPVLFWVNPLEVFSKRALAWFLTHFFLPTCNLPLPPSRPLLPALPEVLLFRFWTLSLQKFTGISICCAFRSASLTATRPHKLNRLHPFPVALGSGQTAAFLGWWIGSFLPSLSQDTDFMRLSCDRPKSLWIKQNPASAHRNNS